MTPELESRLLAWYQANARELPWRRSREFYPVMVSELMLQQTTVAAVIPLYERWMAIFPSLDALARASSDEVMAAWSGLGYYSRARRLHECARLLVAQPRSPGSLSELLALPGLGPYTAAAVASIAFELPHLALDTNALRVLLRFYGWSVRPDSSAVQDELRRKVEGALPDSDFGITNQALMELGAQLCKVRAPACLVCPWAASCQAHALGLEESIPLPKPKKAPRMTHVRAHLFGDLDNGCLLLRGTPPGLLGDLYQPPLEFGGERPLDPAWSDLVAWLDSLGSRHLNPGRPVNYGISGRKLQIEMVGYQVSPETASRRCREFGLEARLWRPESNLALSSLTRKILKTWKETLEALPSPDSKFPGF